MLDPLRRNRALWRTAFIVGALGGVGAWALNPPLSLALLAASALPGFMMHRNHRAITLIEDGLRRNG